MSADLTMHLEAVDTVMRVAHNLRRESKTRALSAAECAVMACDMRLRDKGWNWGPDGPIEPAIANKTSSN